MKRLLILAAFLVAGCSAAPAVIPVGQGPLPSAATASSPAKVSAPKVSAPVVSAPSGAIVAPRAPADFRMWKFSAPVVPIALQGGTLVPPRDPSVLGWWGQAAGSAQGTTLLTGHTVHTGGGELDDLALTPVGARAVVSGITYRVVSVKIISKPDLARQAPVLFDQSGPPQLVVVTCNAYNWVTHEYANNTVVTAVPV